MIFSPKLNILPESQRALTKDLKATPNYFALYGGTGRQKRHLNSLCGFSPTR